MSPIIFAYITLFYAFKHLIDRGTKKIKQTYLLEFQFVLGATFQENQLASIKFSWCGAREQMLVSNTAVTRENVSFTLVSTKYTLFTQLS